MKTFICVSLMALQPPRYWETTSDSTPTGIASTCTLGVQQRETSVKAGERWTIELWTIERWTIERWTIERWTIERSTVSQQMSQNSLKTIVQLWLWHYLVSHVCCPKPLCWVINDTERVWIYTCKTNSVYGIWWSTGCTKQLRWVMNDANIDWI